MKTSILLVSLGIVLIAGTISYLNRRRQTPVEPVATAPAQAGRFEPSLEAEHPGEDAIQDALPHAEEPAKQTVITSPSVEPATVPATNAAPAPTPFSRAIDTLVSPQGNFGQKQAAWKQLRDAGQLNRAIEALRQGATTNPDSAAYPAALGQAQLYQAGVVAQKGGAINEMGILGMQADQNFDAALKLDPANWEAQFFKAAAMAHWPLELNKGDEVIQRLSALIDQQGTLPVEPQFAQTYILLGDQYEKMGKTDYAAATWQLGAMKFPGDPTLQKKIAGR
jgi:tetratricopeptide (TPR) repeat protein